MIDRLVTAWGAEVAGRQFMPAAPGEAVPVPAGLHPELRAALAERGISTLHRHQRDAVAAGFRGEDVLLTTGTSSGKSLVFQLLALSVQLARPEATALVLYPTKALAHDQVREFAALSSRAGLAPGSAAGYDGDTPAGQRAAIRSGVRTLITNPDMLNAGILPHHTLWQRFLRGLSLIVIDEIHYYRGVFGSHLAGVLRRLQRLARHYGAEPQFVMTSATLGNPVEHATRLTGTVPRLFDRDTAPHAAREWLLVQPPLVDPDLGLRRPALQEALGITERLVAAGQQVLLFGGTRQAVEEAVLGLRGKVPGVRSYRSGLLPAERRQIEKELREGTARAVVSTNALELGIDIGTVDAVVMAGYPGSAAAFRQQGGRAGRRERDGTVILVLGNGPLDQYLARHPQHLFGAAAERALCDPDHLLVALDHLRCAAFELPVADGEAFGGLDPTAVSLLLGQLAEEGQVHQAEGRSWWLGQDYPARQVNLRSASADTVALVSGGQTIGTVDADSARWLVHDGAVYLHDGQPFLVSRLDMTEKTALLEPADDRFLTRASRETRIEPADGPLPLQPVPGGRKFTGDVVVTDTVTGYRRVLRQTFETIGRFPLEPLTSSLFTSACGFSPDEQVVELLRSRGVWGNDSNDYGPDWPRLRRRITERDGQRCQVCSTSSSSGVILHVHHKVPFRAFTSAEQANRPENLITLCPSCHQRAEQAVRIRSGLSAVAYALRSLAPLLVMCDGRDLGVHADPASPLAAGGPAVIIYETVPGGIGLAAELSDRHGELLLAARELISGCGCPDGCPSCVGPAGEEGHAGREEALALLEQLT